ncbi:MAG: hypothetical protein ACOCWG_04805 [bacterium]
MKTKGDIIEMRNCCQIISQMIEKIPTDKTDFIKDLQWNYEDVSYSFCSNGYN